MTITTRTFDGGTVGANCVAGANDVESILDDTPIFVTGIHGNAAVRCGGSSNTSDVRIRVDLGLTGNHSGSVYCKNTTAHGTTNQVSFVRIVTSANAIIAEFRAGNGNALNIRVGASNVVTGSSGDLPVNSTFRLDYQLSGTTCNYRVYYNPNADASSTPDRSGTFTAGSGTAAYLILGPTSTSTVTKDWTFDTVRSDTAGAWFDHYATTTPTTGFTIWNGSAEVAVASVAVWNGTTEVPITSWSIAP